MQSFLSTWNEHDADTDDDYDDDDDDERRAPFCLHCTPAPFAPLPHPGLPAHPAPVRLSLAHLNRDMFCLQLCS